MRSGIAMLVACVLSVAASAAPPEVPQTPQSAIDLVEARPFTLEAAATHWFRAEQPQIDSGYLLVLQVPKDCVYPRQVEEPVLYVGNQTAERVNVGYRSGFVVAIVPCVTDDPEHDDYIDLETAPIWFGTPAMPERVDADRVEAERALADAADVEPFAERVVTEALSKGGDPLELEDKEQLIRRAMMLVEVHSPQEKDLVDGVLRPETVKPIVR